MSAGSILSNYDEDSEKMSVTLKNLHFVSTELLAPSPLKSFPFEDFIKNLIIIPIINQAVRACREVLIYEANVILSASLIELFKLAYISS